MHMRAEDQHCGEATVEPMSNTAIESKTAVKATVRGQGSVDLRQPPRSCFNGETARKEG